MVNQYKPTKPKKVKTEKPAKAAKAASVAPVSFGSAKAVKIDKPKKIKEPKVKAPKPEKANRITFGKVQTEKPMKMDKAQKPGIFSKLDPKLVLGGTLVLIAAVVAIMLTVVIPGIEDFGQEIKEITVERTPDVVQYFVGDTPNYDGFLLRVTRNNGESFTARASACEFIGFDSSKATDRQVITVNYQGFTASFNVSIQEHAKPKPALVGISFETLPKTEYKLGERLSVDGGVLLREYKDGSTARIDLINNYVYGFSEIDTPGTYELTVKYKEGGLLATCKYTITVE